MVFGIARASFQEALRQHVAAGGPMHSWWRVIGIALGWGIALGVLSVVLNLILVRVGVLAG
jgi:hypothetical protein